ncbi:MAG: hypothetical protein HKP34_00060 [Nitrosopumilus sp.]|nr:hypothetical protein [Nitrosopumilus sp.]NNL36684.1 hypothetical protein [Nitrosopumilus sp.]
MNLEEVVKKLKETNDEQKINLEQLHEQFNDLRADERYANLPMDELEELFLNYLRTWIKTNSEILELLEK